MDHLPVVLDQHLERKIHVPCVIGLDRLREAPSTLTEYLALKEEWNRRITGILLASGLSFFDSFQGPVWDDEDLGDLQELLGKTQTYMYFGLLKTAFGIAKISVDCERFISLDDGRERVITTAALTEYICYLLIAADDLDPNTRDENFDQIMKLLGETLFWLDCWETRLLHLDPQPTEHGYMKTMRIYGSHHKSAPRAQMIVLSIRILCETLAHTAHIAYQSLETIGSLKHGLRFDERLLPTGLMQGNSNFVDQLMIETGEQRSVECIR